MKNKRGFTLVELLAVIVVLGIILVIAGVSVTKIIENSKKKTKYIAAKEIVEIASAYMYENNISACVTVKELINEGYLEEAVTNPKTGENGNIDDAQEVCKASVAEQPDYEVQSGNRYNFNGYYYKLQ